MIKYFLSTLLLLSFSSNAIEITSPAFNDGESIPKKYACEKRGGENISIPINISNVPENAKSIVLIMDDPDAMSLAGKIWVHWVLFDIPTDVNELPAMKDGKIGIGKSGQNSNYKENYDGPCPPHGMHIYNIKAYSLNIEIKERNKYIENKKISFFDLQRKFYGYKIRSIKAKIKNLFKV